MFGSFDNRPSGQYNQNAINNSFGNLSPSHGGLGSTSIPSSGYIPIGNGINYTLTTLTAGSNVTITNGAGSITIASSGGGGGSSIPDYVSYTWAGGL